MKAWLLQPRTLLNRLGIRKEAERGVLTVAFFFSDFRFWFFREKKFFCNSQKANCIILSAKQYG